MIEKIRKLSKARIMYFLSRDDNDWFEGSKTYWKSVKEELKEAKLEDKKNNSVYFEDELGDVFWTFLCLLNTLEQEGKITSVDKVFDRCYSKFSGRIKEDGNYYGDWKEIKSKQKEKRKEEHNIIYSKKKK